MGAVLDQKEIVLRVLAALAAGFALGLEREGHGRAAGLKTMVLTCVAACLAILLSESYFIDSAGRAAGFLPDRSRMAAGILTGIGFLGAGAILRQGNSIRGVTTGAVLWYSTILGMACGSGKYLLAALGTFIALGVLNLLPWVENHLKRDGFARLIVAMDPNRPGEEIFEGLLREHSVQIVETQRTWDIQGGEKILEVAFKYRRARDKDLSRLVVEKLAAEPGVRRVRWE